MSNNKKQPLSLSLLTEYEKKNLNTLKTKNGVTLADILKSGMENPDSDIGCYAGDAESYELFSPLFDKVIKSYHSFNAEATHKKDMDITHLNSDHLNLNDPMIISTRIRVARNLHGYAFPPCISETKRKEIEGKILQVLQSLQGELTGEYYSLNAMDEQTRVQLVSEHFLFKKGDRFMESAGSNRNWPNNRGIFFSKDKKFLVWINEEDHLRIISMQQGGNVKEVFLRLSKALEIIEEAVCFAYSEHLGYLSSCPTNLGTAMRTSVHIKIPKIANKPNFKAMCKDKLGLSVRGVHGEHSHDDSGIYDISNHKRLGISEAEIIRILIDGVKALIHMEKQS